MLTDPGFYLVAIPAVIFVGISKGGFGSGASFVATPILALIIEPGLALGVMLPLLMLSDGTALRAYWGKWSWADARPALWGSIPGVALGAALWRIAPDDLFRVLIGGISLVFVAWQVFGRRMVRPRPRRRSPTRTGVIVGVIAGFAGFVSHAGGPPVAVYLISRGIAKTAYQATTVLLMSSINVAKVVPYVFLGLFTVETLAVDLVLAPFVVFGTWLGIRAHRIVSERLFFGLTYAMLLGAGSKLLWDGLT